MILAIQPSPYNTVSLYNTIFIHVFITLEILTIANASLEGAEILSFSVYLLYCLASKTFPASGA